MNTAIGDGLMALWLGILIRTGTCVPEFMEMSAAIGMFLMAPRMGITLVPAGAGTQAPVQVTRTAGRCRFVYCIAVSL